MRLTEISYGTAKPVEGYGPGFFRVGGHVLRGFTAAMMLGIVVGTYSSIYVSSSLLVALGLRPRRSRARRVGRHPRGLPAAEQPVTGLPPKSAREGVVTAVVVGVLVFVLCDYVLGASAGQSALVVLTFTVFMTLLDIVRGRYRRPSE